MNELKHQWATYKKGRMRVQACICCGELHLPSNTEKSCESNTLVLDSQIVKAGYRLFGGHASLS